MTAEIMSANDLRSGRVLYLTAAGGWDPDPARAAAAGDDLSRQRLEEAARRALNDNRIIEAALIEVEQHGGTATPVRLRERIRAGGPTLAPEFWRRGEDSEEDPDEDKE